MSLRRLLPWALWLWISAVIVGAFYYAPLAAQFIGQSSRMLFFHVPMAWTSFVGFVAAGVWSVLYLVKERSFEHDRAAAVAVQLGLLFGILATVTGALWARIMWNAWWNWDPRQTSVVIALIFYGAYLALRSAVEDGQLRARLSAVYAILGLAVAPYLFFVVPRNGYSLHPEPVINKAAKIDMDPRMLQVLLAGGLAFTVLFFWVHNLQCRLERLRERRAAREE